MAFPVVLQGLLVVDLHLAQGEQVSVSESCLIAEGVAHDADVAGLDVLQLALEGLLAAPRYRSSLADS